MPIVLPLPITDPSHLERMLQRGSDDEPSEDHTRLLSNEPVENEGEFLLDLFVLCRTTPDLFGPVAVDGWLGAFQGVGDHDDAFADASVTICVTVGDLRITGRSWVLHELFGPATSGIAHEVTLRVLERVGREATSIVRKFNEMNAR